MEPAFSKTKEAQHLSFAYCHSNPRRQRITCISVFFSLGIWDRGRDCGHEREHPYRVIITQRFRFLTPIHMRDRIAESYLRLIPR
jgi:hypothetical protein